jgi:DNA excision repair protein ERCC-2
LNAVAVIGLPLAAYDDIQKEINGYYARKYGKAKGMLIAYTLPAINRGLQAAGRVIRAESERGVLLFGDRRFGNSGSVGVNQFLPEWVRSELIAADAKKGGELIAQKIIEWKMDKRMGNDANRNRIGEKDGGPNYIGDDEEKSSRNSRIHPQEEISNPLRSKKRGGKSANSGRRDLRDLVKELGLVGTPKSNRKT